MNYGFRSPRTVSALTNLARVMSRATGPAVEIGKPIWQTGYLLKTAAGGVAARSGTTAGTATAVLCYLGDDGTITETTDEVDVYNVFGTAIAGLVYVTAKRVGNILVIDAEDCT